MKKQFLTLSAILLAVVFIGMLYLLTSNHTAPPQITTSGETTALPTPEADVAIAFDEKQALFYIPYDFYLSETPINVPGFLPHDAIDLRFFYRNTLKAVIERSVSFSDGGICQYRLIEKENGTFAFFSCDIQTQNDAERFVQLFRCYQDYYPSIALGNFSQNAQELILDTCNVSTRTFEKTTCIYANLNIEFYSEYQSLFLHFLSTPKSLSLNKPLLALTYDDGPGSFTSSILQTLSTHHSKATFFVNGDHVEQNPDVLREIFSSGCEIGNHTNLHESFSQNTHAIIEKTVEDTNDKIRSVVRIPAPTVRPPGGETKDRFGNTVTLPYPIILWDIDTVDHAEGQTVEGILNAVVNSAKSGDIVLLHDSKEITAQATEQLIPLLLDNGFQLITVGELLEFTQNGFIITP